MKTDIIFNFLAAGDTKFLQRHDRVPSCPAVLLHIRHVWVFFEVALCDFYSLLARSANKQLANRKIARYFRG